MASKIYYSEEYNGYYINGKGILESNIPYHKRKLKEFTAKELKDLENYIKAEKDEYNRKLTRL